MSDVVARRQEICSWQDFNRNFLSRKPERDKIVRRYLTDIIFQNFCLMSFKFSKCHVFPLFCHMVALKDKLLLYTL